MNALGLKALNISLQLRCNSGQEQTLNTSCHIILLWLVMSLFENEIIIKEHNRHSNKKQG
jgi:hypothetical protein